MPRHSTGALAAGVGSSTLPLGSIYAAAAAGVKLRECGISNTTSVAAAVRLVRLTTAGTQGAALVEAAHNQNLIAPQATAFNTHTVAPTLGDDLGYRWRIGAAIGAGPIWTFGDDGIVIPEGVANGVGILVVGTGQICDFYFVWDE